MPNLQEKFYSLLQELVQYEVEELRQDSSQNSEKYYILKTLIENIEVRLNLLEASIPTLERRQATLNRKLLKDGR